jgi:hypothetical protein
MEGFRVQPDRSLRAMGNLGLASKVPELDQNRVPCLRFFVRFHLDDVSRRQNRPLSGL